MKMERLSIKLLPCVLMLALLLALLPGASVMAQDTTETEEDVQLVTATVQADLVQPGRVLMSARENHWVYDSVPPLNGPNEEVNPLDGVLAALIACGMYIYEAVGIEQGIETNSLSATVTGELDPRGVAGADISPRLRAFHVTMNVDGPTAEEAAMMAEAFSQRCPIYTTLALSAPIDVTNMVNGEEQDPIATEADPIIEETEAEDIELELAMPSASGRMVEFGRSLMSARGNWWIYDSVPPINGPNEEVNPLDALVGALPACGIMVYEAAARENDIALDAINASVEADLDPRGVAGADVNPRIRAFRVTMNVDGPTMEEAEMLADEFSARCPIYTTFERSAPIEITNVVMGEEMADAAGESATSESAVQHTEGMVVTHPATGAMEPIAAGTAALFTTSEGATARMHTVGLTPGNVYTAWWVIANNPAACEASPCSPQDFLSRTDTVQTEVTYADGVIVGESGEADFAAFLPAGEVENNPWFGHHFPDPTTAEIHLVINDHGSLIPEMAENMVNTYRGGCTDESLPGAFPDTAKADGEPGPNTCALVQAAIYQQTGSMQEAEADASAEGTHVGNGAVLEVTFTYNVDTEEFLSLAAGMAEAFLTVDGLAWKIWKINEDESRAGGVYLFEDADARQAYLDGELFGAVQGHPALSDFVVQEYDVLQAESLVTRAPLAAGLADEMADQDTGTLLEINFSYTVSPEEFLNAVSPLAEEFAATEGLRWKIWALDEEHSRFSGILLFDDNETMDAFLQSDLAEAILSHPALDDFNVLAYEVLEEETAVTRGPVGGSN